jgi:hypothetical protein
MTRQREDIQGEGGCDMSHTSTAKEHQGLLSKTKSWARQGRVFPRTSAGASTILIVVLNFWPPDGEKFLFISATEILSLCYGSPRKQYS